MTVWSENAAGLPPGFVNIPPSAFKSDWEDKPRDIMCAGLRLISHQDLQVARAQARERALRAVPDADASRPFDLDTFIDAHNDALLAHIVSQALCDPNDVSAPWEPFKAAPEDMVREYVTSDGLKLIYDHWERMRISLDPTRREATDEEIAGLPALLDAKRESTSALKLARMRRLIAFILDDLNPTG